MHIAFLIYFTVLEDISDMTRDNRLIYFKQVNDIRLRSPDGVPFKITFQL
jgi:hypothetical protein